MPTTRTEGGEKAGGIQKNLQSKSKHNNKCFSWVTAVRVLSLPGSHSLPHLSRMLSNTGLVSGPTVGQLRFRPGATPVRSCLQCPQPLVLACFPLRALSVAFHRFHRHRVAWLIVWIQSSACTAGGKVWGLLPQPPRPWVSIVVLFLPLHVGRPLGFAAEAAVEDSGLPLWGPGVEVAQLLGLQGFCQHQVLRGVGSYGSRKYSALEGCGNQYWPIHSSILAWRPPPRQRSLAGHGLQGCKESGTTKRNLCA